jgi:hypothetical protein
MERLKGDSLGLALTLLTNTIHGWKDLPGTNTLAYYKHSQVATSSFMMLGGTV